MSRLHYLSCLLLFSALSQVNCELDRVLHLPGLEGEIPFRLYSGYLNASEGK